MYSGFVLHVLGRVEGRASRRHETTRLLIGLLLTAAVQAALLACMALGFTRRYSKLVDAVVRNLNGYDHCSVALLALCKFASFVALLFTCQMDARSAVRLFDAVQAVRSGSSLLLVPLWQLLVAGLTLYLQVSLVHQGRVSDCLFSIAYPVGRCTTQEYAPVSIKLAMHVLQLHVQQNPAKHATWHTSGGVHGGAIRRSMAALACRSSECEALS